MLGLSHLVDRRKLAGKGATRLDEVTREARANLALEITFT